MIGWNRRFEECGKPLPESVKSEPRSQGFPPDGRRFTPGDQTHRVRGNCATDLLAIPFDFGIEQPRCRLRWWQRPGQESGFRPPESHREEGLKTMRENPSPKGSGDGQLIGICSPFHFREGGWGVRRGQEKEYLEWCGGVSGFHLPRLRANRGRSPQSRWGGACS